jgi:hypothetical protein
VFNENGNVELGEKFQREPQLSSRALNLILKQSRNAVSAMPQTAAFFALM